MNKLTYLYSLLFVFSAGMKCDAYTKDFLEGHNVLVMCEVTISDKYTVYWQGNHTSFYRSGPMLSINNITRNFTGEYDCIQYDKTTQQSKEVSSVYINVTYPAKIISMDIEKTTITDNETFSMTVTVEGNPNPETQVIQSITGKTMFETNDVGVLQINYTPRCNGWDDYTLTCKNKFQDDEIVFNLTVLCAPKPSIPPTDSLSPRLGVNIILEIYSVGYPPPTFSWQFNGVPVLHDDDDQHSTVHINGVKVDDFGNYTMKMNNSQGEYTQIYNVFADGPPDPATDLQTGDITFNSAELYWLPGFDYGNNQTFIVLNELGETQTELASIQGKLGDMFQVNYTLNDLLPEKAYTLTVKSNNSRGDAILQSNKIHFTTAKDAVKQVHQDTAFIIGISVGSVGSAFAVGLVVYICMRVVKRKKSKKKQQPTQPPQPAISQQFSNIQDSLENMNDGGSEPSSSRSSIQDSHNEQNQPICESDEEKRPLLSGSSKQDSQPKRPYGGRDEEEQPSSSRSSIQHSHTEPKRPIGKSDEDTEPKQIYGGGDEESAGNGIEGSIRDSGCDEGFSSISD